MMEKIKLNLNNSETNSLDQQGTPNTDLTLTVDEIHEYRKKEFEKEMSLSREERKRYLKEKSIKAQKAFEEWKQNHNKI